VSQFVRRARWLQTLFTPSVTPTSKYPGRVSDDVSLVQLYDAAGWGIPDPEQLITSVTSTPAGATRTSTLLTIAPDEIFRILAASVTLSAGTAPTNSVFQLSATGTATVCVISPHLLPTGNLIGQEIQLPVLPPGSTLAGTYSGGNASTVLIYRVAGLRLPLGTVPVL